MSKRARITLNSEMETGTDQETYAEPPPEAEPQVKNGFAVAGDDLPGQSVPARKALNPVTIAKVIFAGLAVVSVVLLWKNRRP